MSIIKEFREFAVKGNAIDMAVGIVVGAAFGGIVKSLVDSVIMPPIGVILGGVDFTGLQIILKDAYKIGDKEIPAVALRYGEFIQTIVNFLIISFSVFLMVKAINKIKRFEEAAPVAATPPPPPAEERLLTEIRDLLKQGR